MIQEKQYRHLNLQLPVPIRTGNFPENALHRRLSIPCRSPGPGYGCGTRTLQETPLPVPLIPLRSRQHHPPMLPTFAEVSFCWFDCAGTLMHPAEPIGEVYARTAAAFGIHRDPAQLNASFRAAWKRSAPPEYPHGPDENVDRAWWRNIVRESLFPVLPRDPESSAGVTDSTSHHINSIDAPAFEECFQTLFDHYAKPEAWTLYPEVRPVLESLRGRVLMGVLSNFDARLHPLLDGHGLTPFFELIVTSSESAACKPDPAIFHRAATLANVPPAACLLAGDDAINDWQGAATAGWQVFKVDRPAHDLSGLAGL